MTARTAPPCESQAVRLDWSRLLGFDQATGSIEGTAAAKPTDPRLAKLGAKVGDKVGRRLPAL